MKFITSKVLFICIMVLAFFLRFYALGTNPQSLDWDEASLGYNAYSILKTGRDEFGRFFPVSIRSFEDYKPALYTYLTVPSVFIFGLNEFAVRLPSAIMGMLTVMVTYFLTKRLINIKTALLVMFFLAISPWHLQFSRVAFESNVSLFFVFSGLYFFLIAEKKPFYFVVSALFCALSFYAYHSPRLVVPLILLGWTIMKWKSIIRQKKWVGIGVVVGFVILLPFLIESLGPGRARLSSVTVLTPQGRLDDSITLIDDDTQKNIPFAKIFHNRRIIYALAVTKGYLDHFNFDFLFLRGDAPGRHHAIDMGMLYIWEGPFILLGILSLLRQKNGKIIAWWYVCAPAASAITTGTPHAVRALLYLPIYQIFTAVGLLVLWRWLLQYPKRVIRSAVLIFLFIFVSSLYYYLDMYYVHSPVEFSREWQYGYKQALELSAPYEKSVDKIIMTYRYDQPHAYVLFYRKIDPAWYQSLWRGDAVLRDERSFDKFIFRKINWKEDQNLTNILFIGTPDEIPDNAPGKIGEISFLDGQIAFRIVRR